MTESNRAAYPPLSGRLVQRCSRCSRARASARSIRWCSAASPRRASPRASTTRARRSWSPPTPACAWARSMPYKPLVDEALRLAEPSAEARDDRQPRPRPVDAAHRRAATRLATLRAQHADARGAVRVARVERAVVHPLHVRHDRQAEGRAARHRRLRRGARLVDAAHLLRRSRARRCSTTSDIGWVVGHSYIVYGPLINGSTTIMYEGVPIRPDAGIWWKIVAGPQGDGDVLVADGDPRAEEAGPGVHDEARPVVAALPVPRRRAARRADGALGVRVARRARSSTTTGRPRPAGRSSRRSPASRTRRASSAARRFPVYGYDVKLAARGDRRGSRRRREGRAGDRAAAAAGLHDDGVGRRRALREDVFHDVRRRAASTRRSTGRRATRTATTSCSAAPTT